MIGAGLLYIANRFGLVRYFALAAATAAAGAAGSLLMSDVSAGDAVYFGSTSVCMVLSGGLTLWRYLRRHLRRNGAPGKEGGDV